MRACVCVRIDKKMVARRLSLLARKRPFSLNSRWRRTFDRHVNETCSGYAS